MSIAIEKEKGYHIVYVDGERYGWLSKFCCGVDLHIDKNPGALFSILNARIGTNKLEKQIRQISTLKIPNKRFHWNFSDKVDLIDYQKKLSLIK